MLPHSALVHDPAPPLASAGVAARLLPQARAAGSGVWAPAPGCLATRLVPRVLPPAAAGSLTRPCDVRFGCTTRFPSASAAGNSACAHRCDDATAAGVLAQKNPDHPGTVP